MAEVQWFMKSLVGPLYLVASEIGLQSISFEEQPVAFADSLQSHQPAVQVLAQAVHQLNEYFEGKRREFDLPLDLKGTDFQKKVWEELVRIPYGKTFSYQEIARKIQNDKAVRAVGSANGRNPVCIIVPCHRVIAANGSLGGYSGGLEIKTKLLQLEESLKNNSVPL